MRGEDDVTNCRRACGGFGACVPGCCLAHKPGHCCSFRLHLTMTVETLSRDKMLATIEGSHVPPGKEPVPPALNALRMAPMVRRDMVSKCVDGNDTPVTAVNQLQPGMKRARKKARQEGGSSSMYNSRFNPSAAAVAKVVEGRRSDDRGGRDDAVLGDWQRSSLFVTSLALPNGLVLYYDTLTASSGLVVFATEESLQLAREYGQTVGATDCKHDTTRDCRSMYSSLRAWTPWGWVLVGVWVGPNELYMTIKIALLAIATKVPCSDPNCPHTVSEGWEGGVYKRWRCCSRTFRPYIATDKHMPTYSAIEAAGYAGAVLDPFHGYRAFDERLLTLHIRDTSAVAASTAFRLWTRSESATKVHS